MSEKLIEAIVEMKEQEALERAKESVSSGEDPLQILNAGSKAKETVGKVSCLAGNVPLDILCTGTPDDVKAYCRDLIDVAGKGGGFILSTGAGMQGSKAANVQAMIAFSLKYGNL